MFSFGPGIWEERDRQDTKGPERWETWTEIQRSPSSLEPMNRMQKVRKTGVPPLTDWLCNNTWGWSLPSHQLHRVTIWRLTRHVHLNRNNHSVFYPASLCSSSAAFLRSLKGPAVTCAARSCWTLQNGDFKKTWCFNQRSLEDRNTQCEPRRRLSHYIWKNKQSSIEEKCKNRSSSKKVARQQQNSMTCDLW